MIIKYNKFVDHRYVGLATIELPLGEFRQFLANTDVEYESNGDCAQLFNTVEINFDPTMY